MGSGVEAMDQIVAQQVHRESQKKRMATTGEDDNNNSAFPQAIKW
jgi:hypothetical protein